MTASQRFCVYCKHSDPTFPSGCICVVKGSRDLVTGMLDFKSCSFMRSNFKDDEWPFCGPDGLLFEPRGPKSWFPWWKERTR